VTIQSSLRELSIFDLFQILHLHKKTGRLMITDGPDGKEAQILFRAGAVNCAFIQDTASTSALKQLVAWGVLNEYSVDEVAAAVDNYPSLIDCIDGEGFVSKKHVEKRVTSCVEECVYQIFKWSDGVCRFVEDELDEKQEVLISLNTEHLILEGARRIDEWSNIEAKVPSRHSVFKFCSGDEGGQQLSLKAREWEVLSLIDSKRSVQEVNNAVSGDLFSTSKLIYSLVVMNVIELVNSSSSPAAISDVNLEAEEQSAKDYLARGMNHFRKRALDDAAIEFEKAIQFDPDCFEAMRMLGEVYYKIGKLSEALIYLRRARSKKPANQKSMFLKGYVHARLGEIAQAINEWEELKSKTSDPQIVELVLRRISIAREWNNILQEY
jgi:tetratricopeptide (TPR) repeat protein